MQALKSIGESWASFRPTKTQAFWLAAGSVAATLIIGFAFAGWVTGATAERLRVSAAQEARQALAAAVCAEEFMEADGAKARLAALEKLPYYMRSDRLAKEGWATMPDRKEPSTDVAIMCAAHLAEQEAGRKES
jgi:hypothetical protein